MNTQMIHEMYVLKRNGEKVTMLFDKILIRLKTLGLYDPIFERKLNVNYTLLWEAIMNAKNRGCKWFDIGGLSEPFEG